MHYLQSVSKYTKNLVVTKGLYVDAEAFLKLPASSIRGRASFFAVIYPNSGLL